MTQRQLRSKEKGLTPDGDTLTVSNKLRAAIASRGVSAAEVAQMANVRSDVLYSYLDPIRYGVKSLKLGNLRAISRALSLTLYDLIDP